MSFEKYIETQHSKVRDLMLGAAQCGHWYTVPELANIAELSTESVGRAFFVIQDGLYRIHKRRRADKQYEYLIESLA